MEFNNPVSQPNIMDDEQEFENPENFRREDVKLSAKSCDHLVIKEEPASLNKEREMSEDAVNHLKRMEQTPFPSNLCEICDKSYSTRQSLARHITDIHTNRVKKVKKWPCDICGKMLRTKLRLIQHKRIHTGKKPYKCDNCGKHFSLWNALRIHLKSKTQMCCSTKPFILRLKA